MRCIYMRKPPFNEGAPVSAPGFCDLYSYTILRLEWDDILSFKRAENDAAA